MDRKKLNEIYRLYAKLNFQPAPTFQEKLDNLWDYLIRNFDWIGSSRYDECRKLLSLLTGSGLVTKNRKPELISELKDKEVLNAK